MNIINTNELSLDQANDIALLIKLSKEHDESQGITFTESNLNEFDDFPCFFLLYDRGTLASFLSVFIPSFKDCEIYATTHPDFRKKGYFKMLLNKAILKIRSYNIRNILLVNEPKSKIGELVLNKLPFSYYNSELLMKLNYQSIKMPRQILDIEFDVVDTDIIQIFGYKKEVLVGSLKVAYFNSSATIFEFEILSSMRKKGYGTELLNLTIKKLISENIASILLEVSAANRPAHRLYSHNGFIIDSQIDYYEYTL